MPLLHRCESFTRRAAVSCQWDGLASIICIICPWFADSCQVAWCDGSPHDTVGPVSKRWCRQVKAQRRCLTETLLLASHSVAQSDCNRPSSDGCNCGCAMSQASCMCSACTQVELMVEFRVFWSLHTYRWLFRLCCCLRFWLWLKQGC